MRSAKQEATFSSLKVLATPKVLEPTIDLGALKNGIAVI
jgi:hypothetical protein